MAARARAEGQGAASRVAGWRASSSVAAAVVVVAIVAVVVVNVCNACQA